MCVAVLFPKTLDLAAILLTLSPALGCTLLETVTDLDLRASADMMWKSRDVDITASKHGRAKAHIVGGWAIWIGGASAGFRTALFARQGHSSHWGTSRE